MLGHVPVSTYKVSEKQFPARLGLDNIVNQLSTDDIVPRIEIMKLVYLEKARPLAIEAKQIGNLRGREVTHLH